MHQKVKPKKNSKSHWEPILANFQSHDRSKGPQRLYVFSNTRGQYAQRSIASAIIVVRRSLFPTARNSHLEPETLVQLSPGLQAQVFSFYLDDKPSLLSDTSL